jgi:PAS domain S-box-containing protein
MYCSHNGNICLFRRFCELKIQHRLLIVIIPVLIAIVGIITFTTNIIFSSALEDQAHKNANLLSYSYSGQLDSTIRLYFNISQDLASATITAINIETTLQAVRKQYPQFVNVFYTPVTGKILEMAPYERKYGNFDLKPMKAWQKAFATKAPAMSVPGKYFGVASVIIFAPAVLSYVANQEPEVVGVVALVCPLEDLFQEINNVTIGNTGSIFVIDEKGLFLHHEEKKHILTNHLATFSSVPSLEKTAQAMIHQKTGFATYSDKKERKYISFSPIPTVTWSLGVTGSYKEIRSGINKILLINLFVVLIGIVLAIIILYFVVDSVVSPIGKLTKMAQKIEKGDYQHRIPIDGTDKKRKTKDEISELTIAFNKMTLQLDTTFINLNTEIHERKKAELALGKAQSYINNIVDSMPSILVGVDSHGKVTHWNKAAENITGIKGDNAHGKKVADVLPQMKFEMDKITESIKTRTAIREEKKTHQSQAAVHFEDVTIYPLIANGVDGAVIRIDDVTDKIRMEEMMIQSEKMLSIGGLAAGMAHEINNPLAGMMQTADLMTQRLTDKQIPANTRVAAEIGIDMDVITAFMEKRGILGMLTTINESGRRMAGIVNNMLSFARKSDAQISSHMLPELLDKTFELAATDFDLKKRYDFKKIKIQREYDGNVPPVPCDGAKIQQVLLNILRNGAQAMQEAGTDNPGFIVKTGFDEHRKMVRVEIKDNGPGMDKITLKRVFEPFYTTKPIGVGTGLGLSVSYFIVTENHGGEMRVESTPGAGANFIILLPLRCSSTTLLSG